MPSLAIGQRVSELRLEKELRSRSQVRWLEWVNFKYGLVGNTKREQDHRDSVSKWAHGMPDEAYTISVCEWLVPVNNISDSNSESDTPFLSLAILVEDHTGHSLHKMPADAVAWLKVADEVNMWKEDQMDRLARP